MDLYKIINSINLYTNLYNIIKNRMKRKIQVKIYCKENDYGEEKQIKYIFIYTYIFIVKFEI